MNFLEQKTNQEAGKPALLCFKPEERPTGCRITSFIKAIMYNYYINLSLKKGEKK